MRYVLLYSGLVLQLVLTELLKLDIHREGIGKWQIISLLAKVKIDDEELYLMVDTGSQYTFAIWKSWYETAHPNGCDELIFKCYECNPPPCKEGPTEIVRFYDGAEAHIYQHSGSLDIHQLGKKIINFGLTSDYISDHSIHAGLGLGPPVGSIKPYTPILQQLRGALSSTAFSLYLKPGDKPSGQLILGGQDPSLYQGPLFTFDLNDHYQIELAGFRVGGDSYPKDPVDDAVEIDTGAEPFFVPAWALKKIIADIRTRGSREVEIKKDNEVYEVACADVEYLPSLTFLLKDSNGEEVPLVLTPEAYVQPPTSPEKATCVVLIAEGVFDWVFPCNVLVGRYICFDYDHKKIGFASLKEEQSKEHRE